MSLICSRYKGPPIMSRLFQLKPCVGDEHINLWNKKVRRKRSEKNLFMNEKVRGLQLIVLWDAMWVRFVSRLFVLVKVYVNWSEVRVQFTEPFWMLNTKASDECLHGASSAGTSGSCPHGQWQSEICLRESSSSSPKTSLQFKSSYPKKSAFS